jgi:hypothetical protein
VVEQKSLGQKIDNLATRLRDLAAYIEAGVRAEIQLAGLTQVSDRIQAELLTLALTGNPYTTMVSAEIAGIAASTVLATSLTDVCSTLRTKVDYLEFWREAFSAQGIRSFILDNVTPVLNERAKYYCDLLTDGEMGIDFSTKTALKDGELREKFSINIHQKHGGTSYLSNSKGERQRANLAVAFALSDLAELHSNKRVDFRFLDEPFEGVDESGTEAIVALLQELQKRYPTVFIVTHQGHFKDVFPVQITMVKEDGVSRLEEQHGTTTTTGLQ